jgi:L-aspartate oxidase
MLTSDFLVIGSGIAGLTSALELAEHGTVNIITKKEDTDSNTNYAQGGIASVISQYDSFESHVEDTQKGGAGLCKQKVVETVVKEGPEHIQKLIDLGTRFTRNEETGKLALGKEGGHSHRRIVFAADFTGQEVERALIEAVTENPNINIYEHHVAIDFITQDWLSRHTEQKFSQDGCWGAYVFDIQKSKVEIFLAKATLLATGGIGQVYLHTTNPPIATGDGVAMAYRAGATIANMEFVQFHPTSLHSPTPMPRAFLISEAVRGEGAILKTESGEAFMKKYDERGCLAPRDIVARAIDNEMKKRGDKCVYLHLNEAMESEAIKERFPNIYQNCLLHGIDVTKEPIPVVPAAHYSCGGIKTNLDAETNIPRLYACGEAAHTGLHGANRLASNSLLEALVFASRAAKAAISLVNDDTAEMPSVPAWSEARVTDDEGWVLAKHDRQEIVTVMWDFVGIVRSDRRLLRARKRIDILLDEIQDFYNRTSLTSELIEIRNLAFVAKLIIESALHRKESRGLHYTIDYPERDDENWLRDTILKRSYSMIMGS